MEEEFPKKDLIEDFDKAVANCRVFESFYPSVKDTNRNKDYYRNANELLGKLKSYVNFVNEKLLKEKTP